ncbi:MAG: MauE/DoxX family redox-associated membrane protein [Mariniblastus sp.]
MTNPTLQPESEKRLEFFCRVWAAFGLLLFAASWKLWTPQTEFPQIPFFEFLIQISGIVDWIALIGVVISLAICAIGKSNLISISQIAFAVSISILILLNQHRLQPWAYQFVVFAMILATMRARPALFWLRLIVISIYIYSAISKFDYQFVHTTGRKFLWSMSGLIGQDSSSWSDSLQNWITLSFPLVELLVGLALAFQKTRKLGIVAAVMTHALLLATLIRLGHSPGVLAWNLYFIAQAVLLFGWHHVPRVNDIQQNPKPIKFIGVATALFVLLFPMTRPLGICDHWIAWEVYAPRCSRASFLSFDDSEPWSNLLNWSEATTGVPVYPQARFQLAVCLATKRRYELANRYAIDVAEPSNFWTGQRESVTMTRDDQITMFTDRYWLNLEPRSIWFTKFLADEKPVHEKSE